MRPSDSGASPFAVGTLRRRDKDPTMYVFAVRIADADRNVYDSLTLKGHFTN